MKELNFKAVFAKAKTESEVKSLWAQVLNLSVKAQNERIAELKADEKSKKSETKALPKDKAETKGKAKPAETKGETKKETREKREYAGIEAIKLTAAERKAIEAADLKYVDYSDKSFAITGDTKPVKEIMKRLSGRPNRNLSCGFGWIFAKVNENAVLTSLNLKK